MGNNYAGRDFPIFCATWIRNVRKDPDLDSRTKLVGLIIAASSGVQWGASDGTGTLRAKAIGETLDIDQPDVLRHVRALAAAGHLRMLGLGDRGEERLRMIRADENNNSSAFGADSSRRAYSR